jgi:hypothetical protein
MDEEDIFENESADFLVEQRTTDRLMNDIYSNGYRDAFQSSSEDDKLLQRGFDDAYKLFVRLGALIGEIKSLCSYAPLITRRVANSSAFLARLNNKLDKIEKEMTYESLIVWPAVSAGARLEPGYAKVSQSIGSFEAKLADFKQKLMVFLENSGNCQKSVEESMSGLDRDVVQIEYEKEEEASKRNFDILNDMVENLNF